MKYKLITITIFFSILITCLSLGISSNLQQDTFSDRQEEQIVAVNEILKLAQMGETEVLLQKAEALQNTIREQESLSHTDRYSPFIFNGICILFLILVFSYVYFSILSPFDKLKQYATQIAQGNFELPLHYERSNYFGEFTWAFDNMRLEITKARSGEQKAILNNKTVIASLSHDIKTPISSIRAYAEALNANFDNTPEKREKYLTVIMKKCDEVSKLTNDLFLHSLSDLDKLKINPEPLEVCRFLEFTLNEIGTAQDDINFHKPDFTATISADKLRLMQLVENLINNSHKYAKSKIDISIVKQDCNVCLHFRDYGTGILDEDMPFIFDKFYRGKNCGLEQGSGLGLYIVKYIAEQMQGSIRLENYSDGLEVILTLPLQKS